MWIICSFFVSPFAASSLKALCFIFSVKSNTNFTLTSDCSKALWMSLINSLISFSSTKRDFAIFCKVFFNDSDSFSRTMLYLHLNLLLSNILQNLFQQIVNLDVKIDIIVGCSHSNSLVFFLFFSHS